MEKKSKNIIIAFIIIVAIIGSGLYLRTILFPSLVAIRIRVIDDTPTGNLANIYEEIPGIPETVTLYIQHHHEDFPDISTYEEIMVLNDGTEVQPSIYSFTAPSFIHDTDALYAGYAHASSGIPSDEYSLVKIVFTPQTEGVLMGEATVHHWLSTDMPLP